MNSAILLIAHGSRRPAANADLVRLAELVAAQRPGELIEIAYLELASPTIPEGLARCVARGATRIRMSPFFLSAGAHVASDLHEFRREFLLRHPQVEVRVCPPLGVHPRLVDVLLERLEETQPEPPGERESPRASAQEFASPAGPTPEG
jgi:sirohydrochlorin ferrochelatase